MFARGALPFNPTPDEALIQRLFALESGGVSVAQLLFGPLASSLPAPLCVVFILCFFFFLIKL